MAIQKMDLATDDTLKDIAVSLRTLAGLNVSDIVDIRQVKAIVQAKKEKEVFQVGDQLCVPWTDVVTGITYNAVMDIVHFGNAELKGGETVNAMYLQWHYTTPFVIQFDAPEAEKATESTFLEKYNYYTKNSNGSFKLETVVTGSQIPSDKTYYHNEIKDSTGDICRYGYNRWSHSAIRQWLNSDKAKGEWWSAQHLGDVAPGQATTKAGFLTGFNDDFLSCLTPVKVVTTTNAVSEPDKSVQDITYDKMFLPSMEQMYCAPEANGEGEYFEYWKKATGRSSPCAQFGTYPELIMYDIANHKAARSTCVRSVRRGNTFYVWKLSSSGAVNSLHVYNNMNYAPVCAITGDTIKNL